MRVISFFILVLFLSQACQTKSPVSGQSGRSTPFVNVADLGILGNDKQDDGARIVKAIRDGYTHLYFPTGTYLISRPLVLPNAIKLEGGPNAILKATKTMNAMISMEAPYHATQHFQLSDIILDGGGKAKNCIYLYKVCYPVPAFINNVKCMNAQSSGAVFRACQVSSIEGLTCTKNRGHGVEFIGCNALNVYSISAYQNNGSGIVIEDLTEKGINFTGGMSFYGLHTESNKAHGISIKNVVSPVSLFGGWIEGNSKDGIKILDSSVNILSMRISGKMAGACPIHIYPKKNSRGSNVIVENSMVVNDKGVMQDICDDSRSKNTILRNIKKYNFTTKEPKAKN